MADEGRPPLFDSHEALQAKVDEYFIWVEGELETAKNGDKQHWKRMPEHVTITGLAIFLGFESRQSIYDYEERGEFSYTIKKARMRVEAKYEQNLHGTTPTGSIFALKNMGWKDKVETGFTDSDGKDIQPTISINVVQPPKEN